MSIIKEGIDVGASSLKIAFVDGEDNLVAKPVYIPHGKNLEKILEEIKAHVQPFSDAELYLAMFGVF